MCEQVGKRVLKGKLRPHADAGKEAADRPAKADQVITPVRAGTKHRIRRAQFFQRYTQHGGRQHRGVSPNDNHPSVLLK